METDNQHIKKEKNRKSFINLLLDIELKDIINYFFSLIYNHIPIGKNIIRLIQLLKKLPDGIKGIKLTIIDKFIKK